MNTRSFLFPLLLVAMSGTQAQSLPADVGGLSAHPLTLSQRPAKALMDAALVVPEQAAAQLPYGAGFETRQTGQHVRQQWGKHRRDRWIWWCWSGRLRPRTLVGFSIF
jgi:hypothetical protein